MAIFKRVVLGLFLLIIAGSVSSSSAATLALAPTQLSAFTEERCVDHAAVESRSLKTSETSVSVQFSGPVSACANSTVDIALFGADGAVLSRAKLVLSAVAATTTLQVPPFDPAAVRSAAMTVASWALPTTWKFAGTGSTCEVYDVRTDAPMSGASCSLDVPNFIWGDAYWKNLRISYGTLTKNLPARDDNYPASYYAYYKFSFIVKPDAPEWWNWDASGFRDSTNNWCSASLVPVPDGIRVTGRTPDNIAAENSWGVIFDIGQNSVTEVVHTC